MINFDNMPAWEYPIRHYEWESYPDYPEPPEIEPSNQLNYIEFNEWRKRLREFWAKHDIKITKNLLRDFNFGWGD